jgi:hypothetical protein
MNAMNQPLANGEKRSGRDNGGRFQPGNTAAVGHTAPNAKTVAALRCAMFASLTPERIGKVLDKLLSAAESGDVSAAKLVLSYAVGDPERALFWANDAFRLQDLGELLQ